jgi:hypothetical protein
VRGDGGATVVAKSASRHFKKKKKYLSELKVDIKYQASAPNPVRSIAISSLLRESTFYRNKYPKIFYI